MSKTEPTSLADVSTTPLLTVDATYTDPVSGALYVHEDLKKARADWENEQHIGPFTANEKFGDVESWTNYVKVFAGDQQALLTWSRRGLMARLDYGTFDNPSRRLVIAEHHFVTTPQWDIWMKLADGQPRNQRQLIEAFEDRGEDISQPDPAALLTILRALRASVSATADTKLNANGGTSVSFQREAKVEGVEIPPTITIRIPVLRGHTTTLPDGRLDPILYEMDVRIRPGVDQDAHLTFRLSIPRAEQTYEDVCADRVAAAKTLLGPEAMLLRAG